MHERVCARMTLVARVEAFFENFVELGLKREDVADARCARRHPFGLLFSKLEKIEVVAAIFLFLGANECFLGNGEE